MEYFHVFHTRYLRRRKGPAVPERDLQRMDRVKIALRKHPRKHMIKFSAPFSVAKQKHVSGNAVIDTYTEIRNKDDRNDFLSNF